MYYWDKISLDLLFVTKPEQAIIFDIQDVKIDNKKVIDWFTNYLIITHNTEKNLGWIVGLSVDYSK